VLDQKSRHLPKYFALPKFRGIAQKQGLPVLQPALLEALLAGEPFRMWTFLQLRARRGVVPE
jgi:hypothetical protein